MARRDYPRLVIGNKSYVPADAPRDAIARWLRPVVNLHSDHLHDLTFPDPTTDGAIEPFLLDGGEGQPI